MPAAQADPPETAIPFKSNLIIIVLLSIPGKLTLRILGIVSVGCPLTINNSSPKLSFHLANKKSLNSLALLTFPLLFPLKF